MKKGFTLVELLVVIALIGLLIAIAVPSGIAISNKIKKKMLDTKIEVIEQGAVEWGQKNKSKISVGTGNCEIEEIKNDDKVSHCISVTLSTLLNENALEEDKLQDIDGDGKKEKVLINPVTNEPLNNCGVNIYIKNKRVYAKYNVNGTNCGYEKEEDPIMVLEPEIEEIKLDDTDDFYVYLNENGYWEKEYISNHYNDILINFIERKLEEEERVYIKIGNREIDLYLADGEYYHDFKWNDKTGEVTVTYKVSYSDKIKGIDYEKIASIEKTIKVIDNSGPILINLDNFSKYQGEYIEMVDSYIKEEEKYALFDNYDGIIQERNLLSEFVAAPPGVDEFQQSTWFVDKRGNRTDYVLKFSVYYTEVINHPPTLGEPKWFERDRYFLTQSSIDNYINNFDFGQYFSCYDEDDDFCEVFYEIYIDDHWDELGSGWAQIMYDTWPDNESGSSFVVRSAKSYSQLETYLLVYWAKDSKGTESARRSIELTCRIEVEYLAYTDPIYYAWYFPSNSNWPVWVNDNQINEIHGLNEELALDLLSRVRYDVYEGYWHDGDYGYGTAKCSDLYQDGSTICEDEDGLFDHAEGSFDY